MVVASHPLFDLPGWVFDTGIDLISVVKSPRGSIRTAEFLDACDQGVVIIELLVGGLGGALLRMDIHRNMSRVAAQVATNPELYEEDLFRAILDDVEEHGPSAVSAISLLWLKRAMEFLVAGLMELVQDRQLPVRRAARRAYSSTVARYHSWVLQRVFGAALHFVHSRRHVLSDLGVDFDSDEVDDDEEEWAMQEMASWCAAFSPLLSEVHQFLAVHGLDNPSKVSQQGP